MYTTCMYGAWVRLDSSPQKNPTWNLPPLLVRLSNAHSRLVRVAILQILYIYTIEINTCNNDASYETVLDTPPQTIPYHF